LLNVIEGIDDKALDNAWKVSEKELSLGFLAKDYYRHLKWHIEQFESRLNEINDSVR
jgi:hypothetical protein